MLTKILIVVFVVIAGVPVFAATRPDSFRIERTASIKAPPEKIFAQINELKAWTEWSPWEKIDPNLKRTYGGLKPFEAHNTAEFTFARQGEATTVTWAMFGPSPYLSKLIGLVFNMDRMVGGQFETGLVNLKSITEK